MKIAPRSKTPLPAAQFSQAKATARQSMETYVRKNPIKAVGQAAAAGFFLRYLPLGSLFSLAMRLALPAACLAAVMKSSSVTKATQEEAKPKLPARGRRRGR